MLNNFKSKINPDELKNTIFPKICNMITTAPDWGCIDIKVIINNGKIKRIEFSTNESIQFDEREKHGNL